MVKDPVAKVLELLRKDYITQIHLPASLALAVRAAATSGSLNVPPAAASDLPVEDDFAALTRGLSRQPAAVGLAAAFAPRHRHGAALAKIGEEPLHRISEWERKQPDSPIDITMTLGVKEEEQVVELVKRLGLRRSDMGITAFPANHNHAGYSQMFAYVPAWRSADLAEILLPVLTHGHVQKVEMPEYVANKLRRQAALAPASSSPASSHPSSEPPRR